MLAAYVIGDASASNPAVVSIDSQVKIIKEMVERLVAASNGGWGDYRIVPQPVTMPEERFVGSADSANVRVIAWPETEYYQWAQAWDYLAGSVLQRLGNQRTFPLGDPAKALTYYDATQGLTAQAGVVGLTTLPTIDDATDSALEMLAELQQKLGTGATETKKKSRLPLIAFLVAATVGTGILLYYRRQEQKMARAEAPAPPAAVAPDIMSGWY